MCEYIKIFRFFKMATAAILYFRNHELLFADGIWRAQTHHCIEIGRFFAEILRFFEFSRWPPPPSWIFEIAKFYLLLGSRGWRRISMPNFCQNRSIGCEDIKIFQFFKMAVVRHLGFVWAYLDNSQSVLGGLYHSQKFGYDQCRRFCNMNISIFGTFGWKILILSLIHI